MPPKARPAGSYRAQRRSMAALSLQGTDDADGFSGSGSPKRAGSLDLRRHSLDLRKSNSLDLDRVRRASLEMEEFHRKSIEVEVRSPPNQTQTQTQTQTQNSRNQTHEALRPNARNGAIIRRNVPSLSELYQKAIRRKVLEERRVDRTVDKQEAIRYRGLNETKARIADRTESFRQRAAQLREGAEASPCTPLRPDDDSMVVVSMASRRVVVRDSADDGRIQLDVTRTGCLDAAVTVEWSLGMNIDEDGLGCFTTKSGHAEFAAGQCESTFIIEIDASVDWAPLRDCVVRLLRKEGAAYELGTVHTTQLIVVSDAVWPVARSKTAEKAHAISDWHKQWQTINDGTVSTLIYLFITERLRALWPKCKWAIAAVVLRVVCEVAFSYIMVLFVDLVLLADPDKSKESEEEVKSSELMLILCCILASGLKIVHAQCQWWAHDYRGAAKTRVSLRKWIVGQMMWVDDEQMNLMPSHYMSASITGSETAVGCWVAAFKLFEAIMHFVFLTALIAWLVPYAIPAFVVLPISAALILYLRSNTDIANLVLRERDDRYLVGTLADFIDNLPLFRSMAARDTARALYNSAVMASSRSHGEAMDYHVWTDVVVQQFSAVLVGLLLFACSLLVSRGLGSPGELVLVISGFVNATRDLIKISQALLQIEWSSASLREMAQILGMPNDAHELANQTELESLDEFADAKRQRYHISKSLAHESQPHPTASATADKIVPSTNGANGTEGEGGVSVKVEDPPRRAAMKLQLSDMVSSQELVSVAERTARQRRHHDLALQQAGISETGGLIQSFSAEEENDFLSIELTLGGITLVHGLRDGEGENLLKMLAGLLPMRTTEGKLQPTLPFFRYLYLPETPMLVQGSILVNLLLGISEDACPSDKDAWRVAKLCGLPDSFRSLLTSFDVGRDGCHLRVQERQSVAMARALLADPEVLLMHKPLRNLLPEHRAPISSLLVDFVHHGGLQGLLRKHRGLPPLPSIACRTVVLTRCRGDEALAAVGDVLDLSSKPKLPQPLEPLAEGLGESFGAAKPQHTPGKVSAPRMRLLTRDSQDLCTIEIGPSPKPDVNVEMDLAGFEDYVAQHRQHLASASRNFKRSDKRKKEGKHKGGAGGGGGGGGKEEGEAAPEELARLAQLVELNQGHLNKLKRWNQGHIISQAQSLSRKNSLESSCDGSEHGSSGHSSERNGSSNRHSLTSLNSHSLQNLFARPCSHNSELPAQNGSNGGSNGGSNSGSNGMIRRPPQRRSVSVNSDLSKIGQEEPSPLGGSNTVRHGILRDRKGRSLSVNTNLSALGLNHLQPLSPLFSPLSSEGSINRVKSFASPPDHPAQNGTMPSTASPHVKWQELSSPPKMSLPPPAGSPPTQTEPEEKAEVPEEVTLFRAPEEDARRRKQDALEPRGALTLTGIERRSITRRLVASLRPPPRAARKDHVTDHVVHVRSEEGPDRPAAHSWAGRLTGNLKQAGVSLQVRTQELLSSAKGWEGGGGWRQL